MDTPMVTYHEIFSHTRPSKQKNKKMTLKHYHQSTRRIEIFTVYYHLSRPGTIITAIYVLAIMTQWVSSRNLVWGGGGGKLNEKAAAYDAR